MKHSGNTKQESALKCEMFPLVLNVCCWCWCANVSVGLVRASHSSWSLTIHSTFCSFLLQKTQNRGSDAEHGRPGETGRRARFPLTALHGHGPHAASCAEVRAILYRNKLWRAKERRDAFYSLSSVLLCLLQ